MPRLTPEQLKSRLTWDYQVAVKMRSPLMSVTAYRNADDLKRRRNPIVSEDEGHLATHYLVDYYVKTLVGPDEYSDKTSIMFDLFANSNGRDDYPYAPPSCIVISNRIPWTPHFTEGRPVCTDDDLWGASGGRKLLADWVVHVAKLLNFDEIPRTENYGGYTPAAARYWRDKLKRQPLTPNLHYPALPDPAKELEQSPVEEMFKVRSKPAGEMFQPRATANQTRGISAEAEMFAPRPKN